MKLVPDAFRQAALVALQASSLLTSHVAPAGLPVPNPSHSFWTHAPGANVLAKEGSQGNLTTQADVCIIGSGITGVSAAYHLAKLFKDREHHVPLKAVILEARDFCSGATGRNGGHLTPNLFPQFAEREARFGAQEAKKCYDLENYTVDELVKIVEAQGLGDAIDFVYSRHLLLLATEREMKKARTDFAAAKAAGVNLAKVKWHDKDEMLANYGTRIPAYSYPGHNLWPLKLVTQLYYLARNTTPKFSLSLHTHTPVTAVVPLSQSMTPQNTSYPQRWALSTPRGPVGCSYVIHATNAYASHLLPHMQGPSGIIPTRGQAIALRANVPMSRITNASWGINSGGEYWFPRPVGRGEFPLTILGGGREITPPGEEQYVTDDSYVREDVSKWLTGFLPGLFPDKYEKGRKPEYEWTGIMGYTPLGDPFVGPVQVGHSNAAFRGQYVSAGYHGHGMPRGYACAQVIAGMIVDDVSGTEWTAPEWLPRHFLTTER